MGFPPPNKTGFSSTNVPENYYAGVNETNKKASLLDRPFYVFKRKKLPTVGVGNYAFSTLALYPASPIGLATRVRQPHSAFAAQQLYISGQALPTTGFGGVVAGQIIFSPLVNPYNNTGSS